MPSWRWLINVILSWWSTYTYSVDQNYEASASQTCIVYFCDGFGNTCWISHPLVNLPCMPSWAFKSFLKAALFFTFRFCCLYLKYFWHLLVWSQVVLDRDIPNKFLNEIKSALVSALSSNGQISDALNIYDEIKQAGCSLEPKAVISLIVSALLPSTHTYIKQRTNSDALYYIMNISVSRNTFELKES